jgi:hypothetical protein
MNLWASADLRAQQGSLDARSAPAALVIHTHELSDWHVDERRGWLMRRIGGLGRTPTWWGGKDYWRVIYTAGYATVPEDVQEATASWTAAAYWQT